jgi:hypothetical protein
LTLADVMDLGKPRNGIGEARHNLPTRT